MTQKLRPVLVYYYRTEPTSYSQAAKDACWIDAMNAVLKALDANHTWKIVEKPPGVKPIGSKWVNIKATLKKKSQMAQ